jgi:hypothetical protein
MKINCYLEHLLEGLLTGNLVPYYLSCKRKVSPYQVLNVPHKLCPLLWGELLLVDCLGLILAFLA